MFEHGTRYAWGPCLLAHLYIDMHEVSYWGGSSIFAGVTLLHVWSWEHIPVTRPNGVLDWDPEDLYSYRYGDFLHCTWPSQLSYWCHVIDHMSSFIWRPWLDCDAWHDDQENLPFFQQTHWLIDRVNSLLEHYFQDRVLH